MILVYRYRVKSLNGLLNRQSRAFGCRAAEMLAKAQRARKSITPPG
jgi:hypothetical protein